MQEFKKMSEGELKKNLGVLREQIRDLQFKIHSKKIKNHHTMKSIKKDIARILTLINTK